MPSSYVFHNEWTPSAPEPEMGHTQDIQKPTKHVRAKPIRLVDRYKHRQLVPADHWLWKWLTLIGRWICPVSCNVSGWGDILMANTGKERENRTELAPGQLNMSFIIVYNNIHP